MPLCSSNWTSPGNRCPSGSSPGRICTANCGTSDPRYRLPLPCWMSAPATGLRAKFLICLSIATSSNSPVILSSIICHQVLQYTVYYLLKSDYALLCPMKRERSSEPGQSDKMAPRRSEEHKSELQSLMRISYAVFCLKKTTYHYDTS